MRELTPGEVEEEVLGAKKKGEGMGRVGFLLERWVRGVRERRRKVNEAAGGNGCVSILSLLVCGFVLRRVAAILMRLFPPSIDDLSSSSCLSFPPLFL